MKISYISGTNGRNTNTGKASNLIGSLDWAQRVGIKLSTSQKAKITLNQVNPLAATARGIILALISNNRGGIADMLYGMSPFNTDGKVDPSLKNQYDAAIKEARAKADANFPLSYRTVNAPKNIFFADAKNELTLIKDDNAKKHLAFMMQAEKDAIKKYPYLIYPPSNDTARQKYRQFEIQWLQNGGSVDSLSGAVKDGVKLSPRNETFNYLLGKLASGTYKAKDLGLAIRALVGSLLGGDRFKWTDKDIFNPWRAKIGSGNIGRITGDPVTATATGAAATASAAWWIPILTSLTAIAIAALPFVFSNKSGSNDIPSVVGGDENGPGFGSGQSNLTQYALPIGAAVAAYLLLFNDDK